MMQTQELAEGLIFKKYTFGVTLDLNPSLDMKAAFGEFDRAASQWLQNRGPKAGGVALTVRAPQHQHQRIQWFIDEMTAEGGRWAKLFPAGRLAFSVSLRDEDGRSVEND